MKEERTNDDWFVKNCPCCGNEAITKIDGLVYFMIKCPKCNLNNFDVIAKKDSVIKKWNKRVPK